VIGRALVLAGAVALASAAPASAERAVLVAYGEGTTTCVIQTIATNFAGSSYYRSTGSTDCSTAIQQSGFVSWGTGCSGFVARCEDSGTNEGELGEVTISYRVTLRAPLGQGWGVAPTDKCSGVGTDYVTCTFTSRSVLITGT
jgi:hypothetical protein